MRAALGFPKRKTLRALHGARARALPRRAKVWPAARRAVFPRADQQGPRLQKILHRRATFEKWRAKFKDGAFADALKDADLISSPAQMWRRVTSTSRLDCANVDADYIREFVEQKKTLNGFIIPNRHNPDYLLYDRVPNKYFHFHLRADPLHRSFIIDKLINVFSTRANKKLVRKVFYTLFEHEWGSFSPDVFYYIIASLRPAYLNVVARRGRELYRAPILASDTKSTMKAIRFFKRAVMSRTVEDTLLAKIQAEVLDYMY